MMARLVIVRHGNTFDRGEAPRRIGAKTDLPLSESGRAQALNLAAWFAEHGYSFSRTLCSPLLRTRETAQIILSAQAAPGGFQISDLLAEIDHGIDENQSEPAVVERLGGQALREWDEHGIVPPGWTVMREARLAGWAKLLEETVPSTTLLVTSNGAARFALLANKNLRIEAKRLQSLKLRTAAFGIIDIDAMGPKLIAWDQRS